MLGKRVKLKGDKKEQKHLRGDRKGARKSVKKMRLQLQWKEEWRGSRQKLRHCRDCRGEPYEKKEKPPTQLLTNGSIQIKARGKGQGHEKLKEKKLLLIKKKKRGGQGATSEVPSIFGGRPIRKGGGK